MLCLDANILLRCIVQDDPAQSPKALRFLAKALAAGEDVYVPDVIVIETAWALQKRYDFTAAQTATALQNLVLDPQIRFDHAGRLYEALRLSNERAIGVADAYLAAAALESPDAKMVTFDRGLQRMKVPYLEP